MHSLAWCHSHLRYKVVLGRDSQQGTRADTHSGNAGATRDQLACSICSTLQDTSLPHFKCYTEHLLSNPSCNVQWLKSSRDSQVHQNPPLAIWSLQGIVRECTDPSAQSACWGEKPSPLSFCPVPFFLCVKHPFSQPSPNLPSPSSEEALELQGAAPVQLLESLSSGNYGSDWSLLLTKTHLPSRGSPWLELSRGTAACQYVSSLSKGWGASPVCHRQT